MFEIRRYTSDKADEWNKFVANSRQGTFLLDRRYMDYHSDRFQDCSLMLYRKNRLFALLPGNIQGDTFFSHQGLTYGGLITDVQATAETVCEAFMSINAWLRDNGFNKVVYKPVPWIYQQIPSEEDVYALFVRCQARLIERDVSAAIKMSRRLSFRESRLSGVRKALRAGVTVRESDDVDAFWKILSTNLYEKYGATPVHTAEEMKLLKSRFPDEIRLYMAYINNVPVGGTILYLTPQVVHTQYISASLEGRQVGALDLIFQHLLYENPFKAEYFDFGTSAIGTSNEINTSLIFQMEGFGGRSVCYDWYEWDL
jgi:hypothetical protein